MNLLLLLLLLLLLRLRHHQLSTWWLIARREIGPNTSSRTIDLILEVAWNLLI